MTAALQEQLVADRAKLRQLVLRHPDWACAQFMQATQHSHSWVKTWLKRFKEVPPDDQAVLWGKSHQPKKLPQSPNPILLERILELRNHPPANLKRIPGPKTLSYFLQQDPFLKQQGISPPRSTSTIYKLLVRLGCLARPGLKKTEPLERAQPLECIACDFKDATTVEIEPDGKKQHFVEVFNFIDEGTSYLWAAAAREDFNAETVVETLLALFERQGLPRLLRFDRDPRFVGSASGRDFPAAMVRMLYVLGIQPTICPPHQPQKNGFVERYNRSYKYECLLVQRPENLSRVREVTAEYQKHYNHERPHQGRSCRNQPPLVAFPELPALRSLPLVVDPDRWLKEVDGEHFVRKVRSDGGLSVDKYDYYVGNALAGQYVVVVVDAAKRELVVEQQNKVLKRLPLKGLYQRIIGIEEYRELIKEEARSERRGWRANPNGSGTQVEANKKL